MNTRDKIRFVYLLVVTALCACVLLSTIGCGGLAAGEAPGAPDAGDATGTLTQLMIGQVHDTGSSNQRMTGVMFEGAPFSGLTYGVTTSTADTNTWFVPRLKTMTFRVEKGSCTTAQRDALNVMGYNVMSELNGAASLGSYGWNLTINSEGYHTLRCHDLPVSPLGGNSIRNYVRTQCQTDFARTINDGGLPGQATHYTTCAVQVDVPKILAKGTSATQDDRILWHAVAHGVIQMVGVGEYAGNRMAASDQHIAPASSGRVMFNLGELCRTRNWAASQSSILSLRDTANCSDI